MPKVDASTRKRVTADWAGAFEGFDVWKPLRLARRIGPVVQGITLDVNTVGDAYFPTAHIHCLSRDFPVVSLGLAQRLQTSSGVQESIRFSRHEADFPGAVRVLAEQSTLSLFQPPTIEQIVNACHSFAFNWQNMGFPPAVDVVEDSVLIAATVERGDLVEAGLKLARELAGVWQKARLPLDWVSAEVWLEGLTARVSDHDSLSRVVSGQVLKHKLQKVRELPIDSGAAQ
ncbi:hypothetical protein ABZ614_29605 [Streptomyces sp. NPDC013178]|uniref:hypothetical protein n=1 Tax=Streptomyces sp. NPDC013178 TaxID=3155118 RepID=UPI0033D2F7E1